MTLTGTLAREEQAQGHDRDRRAASSAVYAKDGTTGRDGERLFAIDGRDAIAEPGTVRFFRSLNIGDRGDDVLQLKKILAAAGDNPGPMDTLFTRADAVRARAVAGRSTTIRARRRCRRRSVTVSLTQGSGYTLGDETAAGSDHRPRRRADDRGCTRGPANAAHQRRAHRVAHRRDGVAVRHAGAARSSR